MKSDKLDRRQFIKTTGFTASITLLGPVTPLIQQCTSARENMNGLQAAKLSCEYLANPLGIDTLKPRLSWEVLDRKKGTEQSAYRILVADSMDKLNEDNGNLWDSGKVFSKGSSLIEYSGKSMDSRMQCYWKVKLWDKNGLESEWSDTVRWEMGLIKPGDWHARWISFGMASKENPAPSTLWLRKTFFLEGHPDYARAYISSLGYHEFYINGRKVSDAVLSPAVCDYRHRTLYMTHDITPYLVQGENCLAFWLGQGWADHKQYELESGAMIHGQIEAKLTNGKNVRVSTDSTWRTHHTPISYLGRWSNTHFGGERYDASLTIDGWNTTGLDDTDWKKAVELEPPSDLLSAQMVQFDCCVEKIIPLKVWEQSQDTYTIDMGRNFTGWLEITLEGKSGETIQLDYSDRPDKRLGMKTENLPDLYSRTARPGIQTFNQFDQYIPRGEGPEVFRNRFNYHGFRWVTISGAMHPPDLNKIRGELIHSDYERVGWFECSNNLFNKIYEMVLWTYRSLTLGGYVVDCPHRERLGYGAEGQASAKSGLYGFDQGAFFTKWMRDWRDVQDLSSGRVPHTAPTYKGGGGPAWGGIVVTLPWQCYLHYGDTRILAENYPMMQGYLRWLTSNSKDNILQPYGDSWEFLADWVAPGQNVAPDMPWTPELLRIYFNTCYWSYVTQLTANIANVLGKQDEATAYLEQAKRINQAAHNRFFDQTEKTYSPGKQPYLAFALLTGMVPDELHDHIQNNLKHEIQEVCNGHIDSGVLGTYFLLEYLTGSDQNDLVYKMVNQTTYPGWGYLLSLGATTLGERWDGDASQIHSSFLSVGAWFIEGLAGIRPDPAEPGFKHFFIKPAIVGDLTYAKATYHSIRGEIMSHWKIERGQFFLSVVVPGNSTATVHLPTKNRSLITESGQRIDNVEGVRFLRQEDQAVVYNIDSGKYVFQFPWPENS